MEFIIDTANLAEIEHYNEVLNLSGVTTTQISLPFISQGTDGPLHLELSLTRAKFEDLIRDLVDSTAEPVRKALSDAKMTANQIDKVILVGGSTRIPMVQELIKKELGKDPHQGVNPDEVVAVGASIQGAVLTGDVNDIVLLDVNLNGFLLLLAAVIVGGTALVFPLRCRHTNTSQSLVLLLYTYV